MKKFSSIFLILIFAFAPIYQVSSRCNILGQFNIKVNDETSSREQRWRVQVMRLSKTDAKTINFHPGVRLHFDTCNDSWVAIVDKDFSTKAEAKLEKNKWKELGYTDAFAYTEYVYTLSSAYRTKVNTTPTSIENDTTIENNGLNKVDTSVIMPGMDDFKLEEMKIDYNAKEFQPY